jgi:hypothetical protein
LRGRGGTNLDKVNGQVLTEGGLEGGEGLDGAVGGGDDGGSIRVALGGVALEAGDVLGLRKVRDVGVDLAGI